MSSHKNLAWFTISNTPGTTGDLVVSTAVDGLHVTMEAGDDGKAFDVRIFETGLGSEVRRGGIYTHGTTTLTRGTLESSTSGSALNFTPAAQVMVVPTADFGRRMESAALNHVAGSDANTTMAVGALYVVDGATLTADRTYTLPATAAVGDRIGVMMSAGSASYEVLLTAASGDTLNAVAGGTEWSRLFITGEVVIMRCVAANATWVVEQDGRIACTASMEETSATTVAISTFTKVTLDSELFDIGGIADPTTNNRFNIRRAGRYLISGLFNVAAIDAGARVILRVYVGGAPVVEVARAAVPVTGTGVGSGAAGIALSVGDQVEMYGFWSGSTGTSKTTDVSAGARPYMTLAEVL